MPDILRSTYSAGVRDTVIRMLERAVDRAGNSCFYTIDGVNCTFREMDRRSTCFGNELLSLGVCKGHTVATIMDTSEDLFTQWLGINKIGAIWVPVNLAYKGEFLRHQICDSLAQMVICHVEYLDRLIDIADQLPHVRMILVAGGDAPPGYDGSIVFGRFEDHRGSDESRISAVIEPQDLAALLYTSGTTGPSKGCMISHNYLCMQARQSSAQYGSGLENVVWTPLPMFHTAAMNVALWGLYEAARIALSARFSVSRFWDDVEASGATVAMLLSTILPLVAKAPDTPAMARCKGKLRTVVGVPISPEIRQIWQTRFGVEWVTSWVYGQTENNRLTTALRGENPPELSCGRAADEFDVMIFDDNDCPVEPGVVGQIVCRPKFPNVMFEGYWNRPEATALAWRNLWMHTGDLGRLDEQGWLYFVDRSKDYLRSKGENVSSFEVESVFMTHEEIAEAAVHAVSGRNAEDEIKLTAVLKVGSTILHRELCLWAINKLPYFAVPRYFEFRHELPRNPTGKVLKYKLRDDGVTAATWDREEAGLIVHRRMHGS